MKIFYVMLYALILSTSVYAGNMSAGAATSAGFESLTTQNQTEVLKMIADKRAIERGGVLSGSQSITPESVNAWVDVGKNVTLGMVAGAREAGVAVNEFAETPVGKLTMIVLVWHFMGNSFMHLIIGSIFGALGFVVIPFIFRTVSGYQITYGEKRTFLWFQLKDKVSEKVHSLDGFGVSIGVLTWMVATLTIIFSGA